jgi:hypothetical protein
MKVKAKYHDKEIVLSSFNLCHIEGHGDYEIFPEPKLTLDMQEIAKRMEGHGYKLQGMDKRICMLKKDHVELTVFPEGRIIIEQLIPDSDEAAFGIVRQILDLQA